MILQVTIWYFQTILEPFDAGALSAVPALGVVFLLIGSVRGALARQKSLLAFIASYAASQIFVAFSFFMRGELEGNKLDVILVVFLILQILGVAYLVFRCKGARVNAAFLSFFSISYALFTAFVASMSFTGTWL